MTQQILNLNRAIKTIKKESKGNTRITKKNNHNINLLELSNRIFEMAEKWVSEHEDNH